MTTIQFSPKVAIVTGAAQGIGRAIALRLAEDGLDVAINDISSKEKELKGLAEEIQNKGTKALVVTADVTQEDEVQKLVDQTVDALGSVDVVSR